MSLVPLTIVHPGTDRVLDAYSVPARDHPRAATPERARGGGVRVIGDRLELPSPLEVTAEVPAATLAAAYALAYTIVAEAEAATAVITYQGATDVRALLEYEMEPHQASVALTLRWAPAEPTP